jgi:hypothetical protein
MDYYEFVIHTHTHTLTRCAYHTFATLPYPPSVRFTLPLPSGYSSPLPRSLTHSLPLSLAFPLPPSFLLRRDVERFLLRAVYRYFDTTTLGVLFHIQYKQNSTPPGLASYSASTLGSFASTSALQFPLCLLICID